MDLYHYLGKLAYEYRLQSKSKYAVVCTIILENFLEFLRSNVIFPDMVSNDYLLKELTTAARESRIGLSIINQEVIDNVLVDFINFIAYKQGNSYRISSLDLI